MLFSEIKASLCDINNKYSLWIRVRCFYVKAFSDSIYTGLENVRGCNLKLRKYQKVYCIAI
jgi:hypothetical protein